MLGEADDKNKIRSLWPQINCLTNEADHDITTQLSEWRTWQRLINVLFIQKAGHRLSGRMNADGYSCEKNFFIIQISIQSS